MFLLNCERINHTESVKDCVTKYVIENSLGTYKINRNTTIV